MALLQEYQADLLKYLNEGKGIGPEVVKEFQWATDLDLHITKQMDCSIGRSMASMFVVERHLWLYLSGIKQRNKAFLTDDQFAPSGLFGDTVNKALGS